MRWIVVATEHGTAYPGQPIRQCETPLFVCSPAMSAFVCEFSTARTAIFRMLAVFGVILSAYALYVEHKVTQQKLNPQTLTSAGGDEAPFVALCDLSWASCSDVLTSETSHLFGPPNAALGVLFYIAVLLYPSVTFVPYRAHLLLMAVAFSCALTVYLGSVLYRMGDFCILCVSTYVINWTLLVVALRELKAQSARGVGKKKQ